MWCQESASVTVCYTCSDPILTYVLYYSFFLVFMSKKSKRVIVIFMVLNFDFWLQKIFSVLRLTVKTFWSNLHFCHVTEKLMDLWLGWKCVTKLPLRAKIFSLSLTVFDFINFALRLAICRKVKISKTNSKCFDLVGLRDDQLCRSTYKIHKIDSILQL